MIFVTVGTHEQQFDRLVEYMDYWAGEHTEDVIIQTGFSTYEPKNCKWSKLFPYQIMLRYVEQARIVITHGGPSSFIMPLQVGKVPIVVPRQKVFNEHVNNHQMDFCHQVAKRQGNIIVIDNIDKLGATLKDYDKIVVDLQNTVEANNEQFCREFEKIVIELVDSE